MRTQIRIDKITFEVPRIGDEIWVHMELQRVEWHDDRDEIANVIPRAEYVHKTAADMATKIITYTDPVLQHEDNISGYGIHLALEKLAMQCIQENVGGTFDEEGKLWQS